MMLIDADARDKDMAMMNGWKEGPGEMHDRTMSDCTTGDNGIPSTASMLLENTVI
jgi:hypothetical protein